MFALLRNVPGMNHPVVRIVIGIAVLAAALAVHNVIIGAVGALILVMGVVRGAGAITGRTPRGFQ
jgi:hypothetical protein